MFRVALEAICVLNRCDGSPDLFVPFPCPDQKKAKKAFPGFTRADLLGSYCDFLNDSVFKRAISYHTVQLIAFVYPLSPFVKAFLGYSLFKRNGCP